MLGALVARIDGAFHGLESQDVTGGNGSDGRCLYMFPQRCSEELTKVHGAGLNEVSLYVYAEFAVLRVGPLLKRSVYKSMERFSYGVDLRKQRFALQCHDDVTEIGLVCYGSEAAYSPSYIAQFKLVSPPWEGEWVVRSAQGSGAPWGAQQCVEITMAANGVMTLGWEDGRPASVGRMEHLAADGFDVTLAADSLRCGVSSIEDYYHLRVRFARANEVEGGGVSYGLERKEWAAARRAAVPLAPSADKHLNVNVVRWEGAPELRWRFQDDWGQRVELVVHADCVLLKLGSEGVPYKQRERFTQALYNLLAVELDSTGTQVYQSRAGWRPSSFALSGEEAIIRLSCYYSSAESPPSTYRAFEIDFAPCNVWEGVWRVQGRKVLTADGWNPAYVVGAWDTVCDEIDMTGGSQMVLTRPSGVVEAWRIRENPRPLSFRAYHTGGGGGLACSVCVQDYNRIQLVVSTESSVGSPLSPLAKPTVEYTLARRRARG
jgi:hypothetical protein